jgi:hypothetical protein
MFLFETNKSSLQPSLSSSMQFLYKDSDRTTGWRDFVPIYIPESRHAATNPVRSSDPGVKIGSKIAAASQRTNQGLLSESRATIPIKVDF